MTEERRLLYGLVALALHFVTGVLIVAAGALVPVWWTAVLGLGWLVALVVGFGRWRDTRMVLSLALGILVVWLVGTLALRR